MWYLWAILILLAIIATLVLIVSGLIYLITRAVRFMKLEEDMREQWEREHDFYDYESKPTYKK